MINSQTSVQIYIAETGTKDIGSDTNSSANLSITPAVRRRGSDKGRALRAVDLSPSVVALFWQKVNKASDCWLFEGYRDRHGYGLAYAGKRPDGRRGSINQYAHRISYALSIGPLPSGSVVMHSCDVPNCVNPAHLSLGSQAENIADRDRRGRTKKTSPRIRKISAESVIEMRNRRDIPSSYYARLWNVCVSHINRIRRGEKRKVS